MRIGYLYFLYILSVKRLPHTSLLSNQSIVNFFLFVVDYILLIILIKLERSNAEKAYSTSFVIHIMMQKRLNSTSCVVLLPV